MFRSRSATARTRIALLTAVTTVLVVGLTAAPARAGGQHAPLYGDLNVDGLVDRATLVDVPPDDCGVVVELGRPGGGYELPVAYTYPKPGVAATNFCPDLGTMIDLGGDGNVELAVGWFEGVPPGVSNDLLILRDFKPAGDFPALDEPDFIGSANFTVDKRRDLYLWSDRDRQFITLLNTPDGGLVHGPLSFCGAGLAPQLRDFNRNGAMDMVTAYQEGCGDRFSGVSVVLDNGDVVNLERHRLDDDESYWSTATLDANSDGRWDVRIDNLNTGNVIHWIGDGAGGFAESPAAVADTIYLTAAVPTVIDVLANDAVTDEARLEITGQPRYGQVRITDDGTVLYTPHPRIRATDRFVYRITQDGRRSATSVYVRFRS